VVLLEAGSPIAAVTDARIAKALQTDGGGVMAFMPRPLGEAGLTRSPLPLIPLLLQMQ